MKNPKPINTTRTLYLTCPYCGFKDNDAYELPFVGLDDTINTECKSCEMEYQAERIVYVRYSTLKLNKKPLA